MKELIFTDLSNLAQVKAIYDYMLGWSETHEENDLSIYEAIEILSSDRSIVYKENGEVFEDNWD